MRIEEYKALNEEIDEGIKKQETTSNLVITILGISALSSTPDKDNSILSLPNNIYFLLAIMFVSCVLLSRIIHYRNTVYRCMTYLELETDNVIDEENKKIPFVWERHVEKFKSSQFGNRATNINKILSLITLGLPFLLKNAGYFVLSVLVSLKTFNILKELDQSIIDKSIIQFIIIAALVINFILTLFIFCDRLILQPRYSAIWKQILDEEKNASNPSTPKSNQIKRANNNTSILSSANHRQYIVFLLVSLFIMFICKIVEFFIF